MGQGCGALVSAPNQRLALHLLQVFPPEFSPENLSDAVPPRSQGNKAVSSASLFLPSFTLFVLPNTLARYLPSIPDPTPLAFNPNPPHPTSLPPAHLTLPGACAHSNPALPTVGKDIAFLVIPHGTWTLHATKPAHCFQPHVDFH